MKIRKRTIISVVLTLLILFITSKYWLIFKTKTSAHFEFEIFIIISFLSFLLMYKITGYLADFKTIKEKSRIDIIFITIFFAFLFVPISHINQDDISLQEKRVLAKWEPLFKKDYKFNYNFGKDFENWFNDRFAFRKNFVDFRTYIMIRIANKCDKGFIDKNTQTLYLYNKFYHTEINSIKNNFKELYKLNDFCNEHNIKLYTLIVPLKEDIHTTKYNNLLDEYKHNDFLGYVDYLQKENIIKIIYPYSEMKKFADEGKVLYFKTEHHWTDEGAFIGYQSLMEIMKKDYPYIKVLTSNDFNYFKSKDIRSDFERNFTIGQYCSALGLPNALCKNYHNYDYTYYKHKNFDKLNVTTINTSKHMDKLFYYDNGTNLRVILLGSSQSENLTEFIPFTFKDVKRIRNNSVKDVKKEEVWKIIKRYENEIIDYKPDIIIFCISYDNIRDLHDLFNME